MMIYNNEACVVINKLPGESSENILSEIFRSENILSEIFRSEHIRLDNEEDKFLKPVHRLDVPVSGCLLLARTPEAAAFLGAAFARRDSCVEKKYWAIIEVPSICEKPETKKVLPEKGDLVHWLGVNGKTNKAFTLPPDAVSETSTAGKHKGLKKAMLRYRIAGQGDHYLFLEIDLVTGRHHQIRAQLAALGLHIKGDLKYGARRSEKSGGIRLHAYSLAFPNPLNPSEIIRVKAQPPVMDSLWTAFSEAVEQDIL
jgi:23S rRNA pseudouridine1911/1915/1917 synthase